MRKHCLSLIYAPSSTAQTYTLLYFLEPTCKTLKQIESSHTWHQQNRCEATGIVAGSPVSPCKYKLVNTWHDQEEWVGCRGCCFWDYGQNNVQISLFHIVFSIVKSFQISTCNGVCIKMKHLDVLRKVVQENKNWNFRQVTHFPLSVYAVMSASVIGVNWCVLSLVCLSHNQRQSKIISNVTLNCNS